MPANLKNSAVATGQEKVSFHSNPNEIAFISHASKVMLKILQASLQQYVNHELQIFKMDLEKAERNQRSNCQHTLDH